MSKKTEIRLEEESHLNGSDRSGRASAMDVANTKLSRDNSPRDRPQRVHDETDLTWGDGTKLKKSIKAERMTPNVKLGIYSQRG